MDLPSPGWRLDAKLSPHSALVVDLPRLCDLAVCDAEDNHLVDVGEPPSRRDAEDWLGERAAVRHVRYNPVAFGYQGEQIEFPVRERCRPIFGDRAGAVGVARHLGAADVQLRAAPHQDVEPVEAAVVPCRDELADDILVHVEVASHDALRCWRRCQTTDARAPGKVREPSGGLGHPAVVEILQPRDTERASLACAGEVEALAGLLERYRPSLYAGAIQFLRSRDDALDAVQETSLIALARIGSVRDPEAIGGWLHAVLRNACLMRLRRGRP